MKHKAVYLLFTALFVSSFLKSEISNKKPGYSVNDLQKVHYVLMETALSNFAQWANNKTDANYISLIKRCNQLVACKKLLQQKKQEQELLQQTLSTKKKTLFKFSIFKKIIQYWNNKNKF